MQTNFKSDFFAGNRRRLGERFTGKAPIVITANGLLQRGADSTYHFSQDANFWYLTGINEPDIVLVMDRDKEYLIVPARSASRQAFDGVVDHEPLMTRSGIREVYDDSIGWEKLGKRLKKVKHFAALGVPPAYVDQYGLYTNPARAALIEKAQTYNSEIEMIDLTQHLGQMRMLKQPEELKAIQQAIDITIGVLQEITDTASLKKYAHEYEVEADLTRGYRRAGADGHAFDPIVAGGARACTLHNVANNGTLSADELLLIDTGAEIEHYAADITRTYCIGKYPSRRQETVYEKVLEVQQYAMSLLKPGTGLKDYEQKIEKFMGKKLQELGLIKEINHENVRQYYPHGTSHFMGLNVHDIGDYTEPLQAGIVMTVEPGIYIKEESIGIRIEDDVLITDAGIKVLTDKLPRTLG